jgi:CBS domain-containing protein
MRVGNVCQRRIVSIDEQGTIEAAAALMREHHVGALVVTREAAGSTQVSGVVTDRDMAVEVLARGRDAASLRIADLASTDLVFVPEDADTLQAIEAMQDSGTRRVLLTRDGGLFGIVSLDDLLGSCARELAALAAVVGCGIEREAAQAGVDVSPATSAPLRVPAMGTAGWRTAVQVPA